MAFLFETCAENAVHAVGGIFEVSIDNDTVYTNQETYRFPNDEEIFEKIDAKKKA